MALLRCTTCAAGWTRQTIGSGSGHSSELPWHSGRASCHNHSWGLPKTGSGILAALELLHERRYDPNTGPASNRATVSGRMMHRRTMTSRLTTDPKRPRCSGHGMRLESQRTAAALRSETNQRRPRVTAAYPRRSWTGTT